jgi:purine nucleosidase
MIAINISLQKQMRIITILSFSLILTILSGCRPVSKPAGSSEKIRLIFDTDANNELDDQHALAYLLFSGSVFDVAGVTVNRTSGGGDITAHYKEAERIIKLCNQEGKIPLYKGSSGDFSAIRETINSSSFDGSDAVNFMIDRAKSSGNTKLIILAVGKLTNVALALEKEPRIADRIKIVWLGSNYPEKGEYNQENDTMAMNYILNTPVDFEMVTVRYGKETGTDFVRVTRQEIDQNMPGRGPVIAEPVMGRHNDAFVTFGDYSVNLFNHADYYGDPPSRALFDMAAAAILKNPAWAKRRQIHCPVYKPEGWIEQPDNKRMITVWESFERDSIVHDFFRTMKNYTLVAPVMHNK